MSIHDWTRVSHGIWHDFHLGWAALIRTTLNKDLLPQDYYAMTEHNSGPLDLDVIALKINDYVLKRRTIVVRHNSDDRIIALIELVSPGNKSSRHAIKSFVEKAVESIYSGYHLLIVDLFPSCGAREPSDLLSIICGEITDGVISQSLFEPPRTVASIKAASHVKVDYGYELIDLPLFLTADTHVNVPLEATYRAAYAGVPRKYREQLEGPATDSAPNGRENRD